MRCPQALRPGQNTTEYLLLMAAVLVVFNVVAFKLKSYLPELTERLLDLIVRAALSLAMP